MPRSVRRRRTIVAAALALALALAAMFWVRAVERWIAHELEAAAAMHLTPAFAFRTLSYSFPRTITLRDVRLASPDPDHPNRSIDILSVDSITVELAEIPRPDQPFRMQRLELTRPRIDLVRLPVEGAADDLLGWSDLARSEPDAAAQAAHAPEKLSAIFEARTLTVEGASVRVASLDALAPVMLLDGIGATLKLQAGGDGAYGLDFALAHSPALSMQLKGRYLADDERLSIESLTATAQVAREQDRFLTPALQQMIRERDISGALRVTANGALDFETPAASDLHARLELSGAHYAAGDFGVAIDRVAARVRLKGQTLIVEHLEVDASSGQAEATGELGLEASSPGRFEFHGTDLQLERLLHGAGPSVAKPRYTGRLDFKGGVHGRFSGLDPAVEGHGRLSLRNAKLARVPLLAEIDEALDRAAEAAMLRQKVGHDSLSLEYTLDDGSIVLKKIRMNSRWYGLRGHGRIDTDARLDLDVDAGPVERVENDLPVLGDALGEISETLLRAHVTGTFMKPKIQIEILRHPARPLRAERPKEAH